MPREIYPENWDGDMGKVIVEHVDDDPDQVRRDDANDVIARRKAGGPGEVTDSDVIDALLELRG
jgi:hypothetical protein